MVAHPERSEGWDMHEVFGLVWFYDVPPSALYNIHEFPLPTFAARAPEYYNQAPLQVGSPVTGDAKRLGQGYLFRC